ncbi:MAG: enoyl-CoA hydratase/isomerase family protein [Clostridiales bacterium]|nr:enoyl-CoA hydratase/isomerase family protein [Clostridiales bacterium]
MNVLYEVKDHVAVLTINRPEVLNALNLDVFAEIKDAVEKAERDEDVYVVVITGAGRAFVAGADIKQMKDLGPMEARHFGEFGNEALYKIETLTKPVIAAVNGYALGGGCELACACDIRIASDRAKFGQPEVGLGIIPGAGGTVRLPRIVGAAKAKELIFTGRIIDAQEALRIGLVSDVVPAESLMEKVMSLAKEIAANAQIAVRQAKASINNALQCDVQSALKFEAQAFAVCFSTEDQKDAMTAFVNKSKVTAFKNK